MVHFESVEEEPVGDPGWRPTAADFEMLGVRPQEARLPVIRRAARRTAAPLVAASIEGGAATAEDSLASTLAAAYRLIDPRRRALLTDRISLLHAEPAAVEAPVWWKEGTQQAGQAQVAVTPGLGAPLEPEVEAPPIGIDSSAVEVHRLTVHWVREAERRSRRQKYFTCFGITLALSCAGAAGWLLGGDAGRAAPSAKAAPAPPAAAAGLQPSEQSRLDSPAASIAKARAVDLQTR